MANLVPQNIFSDVRQLETDTVALGGEGAPMNWQAQDLANRTHFLKLILDSLVVNNLETADATKALSAEMGVFIAESFGQAIADLLQDVALKADLDSPSFTGNPSAPTQTQGTNDSKLATTQFVNDAVYNAINALISSAPENLNQLNELAAALNNDPNFATTVLSAVANKLAVDVVMTLTNQQKNNVFASLGLGSMASANASDYPNFLASQTVTNQQKTDFKSKMGIIDGESLANSSNTINGTNNLAIRSNNCTVNGTSNLLLNCQNLIIDSNQQHSTFIDYLGNAGGDTLPVLPKQSVVRGFRKSGKCTMEVKSTFSGNKPANGSLTLSDANGVKPIAGLGSASSQYYTVHELVIHYPEFGNFYGKRRIIANDTNVLIAVDGTDLKTAGNTTTLQVTAAVNAGRLDINLQLDATYNSNALNINAELTSYIVVGPF